MTALLSLSVLGVVWVGWIPLAPVCAPVPDAMSVVAANPMTLTSVEVVLSCATNPLTAVTATSVSVMMLQPPVQIGTPASATNITLPSVSVGLVTCPAIFDNTYLIRYCLSA